MFIVIVNSFIEFSCTQHSPLSFLKTHKIRSVGQCFSYPLPNVDAATIPVKDSEAVLWPHPGLVAVPNVIQCAHFLETAGGTREDSEFC